MEHQSQILSAMWNLHMKISKRDCKRKNVRLPILLMLLFLYQIQHKTLSFRLLYIKNYFLTSRHQIGLYISILG